ncbi:spore gernimation protein GerPD [Halobacillus fulvus]|nr:spore gernimation protein GerPD [Halobacillus fulvus]
MNHIVHNYGLHVGHIHVTGISASSVFLIGDNKTIKSQSFFDTPPESLIIGPFSPIAEQEALNVEEEAFNAEEAEGIE